MLVENWREVNNHEGDQAFLMQIPCYESVTLALV